MRPVGILLSVCGSAMVSLVLARVHPFGDAGLYSTHSPSTPVREASSIPPEVSATLAAKCGDCHSTAAHVPFYGRFAPASWLMERDILMGRKQLNLSSWDAYSRAQQQTLEAKIVEQVKARKMPPLQYRIIHWDARITDGDVQTLTEWPRADSELVTAPTTQLAGEGDPVKGKEVFEKRCTGCHAMESNREGPKLHGVFGRTSGTVEGFPYSEALMKAHIRWDERSLEQWLADPDTLVPGNNMEFHVAKPDQRRDIISFFKHGTVE